MTELFGPLSSSLLVSFRKSKRFHPSRVKLRETHVKRLLVDSEVQDPTIYFRDEVPVFRSLSKMRPAVSCNKHDYTVFRIEETRKYELQSPIAIKAYCYFDPKQQQTEEDKEHKLEVVLMDFFGRIELGRLGTNPNLETGDSDDSRDGDSSCYSCNVVEWNVLGWSFQTADGTKYQFSYEQNQSVPFMNQELQTQGFQNGDLFTQLTEESVLEMCRKSQDSPIVNTIRACANWITIQVSNVADECSFQNVTIPEDVKLVIVRLITCIKPLKVLLIDTVAELTKDEHSKQTAVEFKQKFANLELLSKVEGCTLVEIIPLLETDWIGICQTLFAVNNLLIMQRIPSKLTDLKERDPELANIRYPPKFSKITSLGMVINWLEEAVWKTPSDQHEKYREHGANFSAWVDNCKLHIRKFSPENVADSKSFTVPEPDSCTKNSFRSLSKKYLILDWDSENYLLNLELAMLQQANRSFSEVPIQPLLQKIQPETTEKPTFSWPNIQNGFLTFEVVLGLWTNQNSTLKCQFLKQWLKKETPMMTLVINKNPELENKVWSCVNYFYSKGILFLVLKSHNTGLSNSNFETVCLAAYRINMSANTLQLISKLVLPVDMLVIATLPDLLEYRIKIGFTQDHFMRCRGKVFSIVSVSDYKPCLWIHCFHRNMFVPIGGGNTSVPGMYSFGSRRVIEFELFDNNVVGLYSFEVCAFKQHNQQVYRMSRLYFRF